MLDSYDDVDYDDDDEADPERKRDVIAKKHMRLANDVDGRRRLGRWEQHAGKEAAELAKEERLCAARRPRREEERDTSSCSVGLSTGALQDTDRQPASQPAAASVLTLPDDDGGLLWTAALDGEDLLNCVWVAGLSVQFHCIAVLCAGAWDWGCGDLVGSV